MHTENRQTVSSSDIIMPTLNNSSNSNNNNNGELGGGSSPTGATPSRTGDDNSKLTIAIEACQMIQSLIDISYNNMIGIRTQCDVSKPEIQKEIRTLEVRFSKTS